MSASFNGETLVDLEKIFLNDSAELVRLKREFKTNGWCFVRLSSNPQSFVTQLMQISESLSDFFALDRAEKSNYASSNPFGYSRVDHKEGIRVLTNEHGVADDPDLLPLNVKITLQLVSKIINDLTNRLKPIITRLALADARAPNDVGLSPLNMLDVAHYYNSRRGPVQTPAVGYDTSEVNCVPHYDPGLFSLSILSTCEGLQLKDQRANKWIDGPVNFQLESSNIGVLWLGEAAAVLSERRFQAGIHRVIYPRTIYRSRLTIWQEVCTTAQIRDILEENGDAMHLPSDVRVQLSNQPDSLPVKVLAGGETKHGFLKRMEGHRGIPMMKSPPGYIYISSRDEILTGVDQPPSVKSTPPDELEINPQARSISNILSTVLQKEGASTRRPKSKPSKNRSDY